MTYVGIYFHTTFIHTHVQLSTLRILALKQEE